MFLIIIGVFLALCIAFAWTTRGVMSKLPSAAGTNGTGPGASTGSGIVDLTPWQTAQALAQLAVTAEENEYARQAEHLADHEVDQAFAAALREANLRAKHQALTGNALAISNRVEQLKQTVAQDQAAVSQLSPAQGSARPADSAQEASGDNDLEIAKAQLQLDSDELADAQQDLDRATGDERPQIQSELSAHEASMKKYDRESQEPVQSAVLSAGRYGTLAGRLGAWSRQRSRLQMLVRAAQQAESDVRTLTARHDALSASANSAGSGDTVQDRAARLAGLKDRSAERQLLSIYDDRIQTEQQLAGVYRKWSAQVQAQHRMLVHLILNSLAWVFAILACMVLGAALVRRLMEYPVIDARQRHTLRSILELCIEIAGAVCILLVIFGAPRQTATMLGLATAALTIALQDFILAFLGWFVLIGKRGIRVGDTVEIDGIGGEVMEIGLMATTLLETGTLADRGCPTGRRITLMNGFAIRGKYFNFSTAGQWMWDKFDVSVPASEDTHSIVEQILHAVEEETAANARQAEQEWSRSARGHLLSRVSAAPLVDLRPSGSDFDVEVRYVTRASERFEMRNRLYGRVIELLGKKGQVQSGSRSESAV